MGERVDVGGRSTLRDDFLGRAHLRMVYELIFGVKSRLGEPTY